MTVSVIEARALTTVPERADDTCTPVVVDQLVSSLTRSADAARKHPLTSLSSYTWFSVDNYHHVVKWCAAAVAAVSGASKRGAALEKTVQFLVNAMVDRYHYDRALYAASCLSDNPSPQRLRDVSRRIEHDGWVYNWHLSALASSLDMPPEAIDRVADIAAQAVPDKWHVVKYEEAPIEGQRLHRNGQLEIVRTASEPSKTYDPIIFACYGDWIVKVAEWV